MKISSENRGFSLVELLTVIAIIAILAAVIFPVMGVVKERAKQNNCMANLHQIAQGVAMFKTDNRRYPVTLVGAVDDQGRFSTNGSYSGTPVDFGSAKNDAHLFSEYVPSVKAFHCPSSNIVDTKATVSVPLTAYGTDTIDVYTYNSYEVYVNNSGVAERHYCTDWARKDNNYADVAALSPDADSESITLKQADYERQLKFRNPPADTVVTWCSYHQSGTGTSAKGNAIVVFLDGSAQLVPANKVNACKWRVKPSKG